MKIARSKIENYISQTLSLYSQSAENVNKQQTFSPTHVVNMAVSTCVLLNKSQVIKCSLPNNTHQVLGNSAAYLQAFTTLLTSIAKHTNQDMHLKLELNEIDNSTLKCLLIVSVDGGNEQSTNLPSSLNYKLNYNLFLVRKLVNKINGEFYIYDKGEGAIDFVIDVHLKLPDEEQDLTKKNMEINNPNSPLKISPNVVMLNKSLKQKRYKAKIRENKSLKEAERMEQDRISRELDKLYLERQNAIKKSIQLKNKIKLDQIVKKYRINKLRQKISDNNSKQTS